jgi:hypothetical protein
VVLPRLAGRHPLAELASAGRDISRRMQEFEARLRTDPEAVRAETLAYLSQFGRRLKEFRRVNGRRPRKSELAGILDSVGL